MVSCSMSSASTVEGTSSGCVARLRFLPLPFGRDAAGLRRVAAGLSRLTTAAGLFLDTVPLSTSPTATNASPGYARTALRTFLALFSLRGAGGGTIWLRSGTNCFTQQRQSGVPPLQDGVAASTGRWEKLVQHSAQPKLQSVCPSVDELLLLLLLLLCFLSVSFSSVLPPLAGVVDAEDEEDDDTDDDDEFQALLLPLYSSPSSAVSGSARKSTVSRLDGVGVVTAAEEDEDDEDDADATVNVLTDAAAAAAEDVE